MKAAIYCRLSEEDRNKQCATDDSGSIQNQKAMLIRYATERGWEIYQIYSDDDYAGSDRRRPQFNRLLEDAQQRRFEIILCKTQSRFTRELELVEKYIHGLFPQWGIRFISIVDNADTANKGNKKSRQINGLVNEWYLEDMSENIRSVLDNRRFSGLHIGAFALYGYRKNPDRKGHLLVDEEAAAVVREVFTRFAGGMGKTAIARLLNERGVPNPTEYKRLHGLRYQQPKGKTGTLWRYDAIASMLVNEIYIGNMVQGKYGSVSYKTRENKPRPRSSWIVVEGTHEPIIDRALWDQVQARIGERCKPFETGHIGLFARKVRCAFCGYTMRSNKQSNGKHYLQCSSRHVSAEACPGAFISYDRLERMILTELRHLTETCLDREALIRQVSFCNDLEAVQKRLTENIATYQKRVEEYTRGLRELYMDKVRGSLTESDYQDMSQTFREDRARYEEFLRCAQEEQEQVEARMQAGDNRRDLIDQYTRMDHLTRAMVEALIDHVDVYKRIPGSREVPIAIYWRF